MQFQEVVKEFPGVILNFWAQVSPPCMRIKPIFESLAMSNDNPNLVFATVDIQEAGEVAQFYQVRCIPTFLAFHNGQKFKTVEGSDELEFELNQAVDELRGKIPKVNHKHLIFKKFKPNHLAVTSYNERAGFDKMKKFIEEFVTSDTVKNEVGEVQNFTQWMVNFDLSDMPQKAIDELL